MLAVIFWQIKLLTCIFIIIIGVFNPLVHFFREWYIVDRINTSYFLFYILMQMKNKIYLKAYLILRWWWNGWLRCHYILVNHICTCHHHEWKSPWNLNMTSAYPYQDPVLSSHFLFHESVHSWLSQRVYTRWPPMFLHSVWPDSWLSDFVVEESSKCCFFGP